MEVFLATVLSFPTVVYSALLVVVMGYWLVTIVGGLDVDALDGGADGALEALDGADGALEGLDGAGGAIDGADGALEASGAGGVTALGWLTRKRLPISVTTTIVVLTGWAVSYLGTRALLPMWSSLLPQALGATLLGAGAFAVGWVMSSILAAPMAPLFKTHLADGNRELVGKSCRIQTGTVDEEFGSAVVIDGSSSDVIQVRFRGEGQLRRGDEALIVSYQPETNTFRVEPMAALTRPRAAAPRNVIES